MSSDCFPGVYIEEASAPPSVTPVATAIPVFIGYTEFAKGREQEDLTRTPVRITSLVEYARYFGAEAIEDVAIRVERRVTVAGVPVDVAVTWTRELATPRHLLPYAMRMFFANGGGPCFVYSLGPFGKPTQKAFTDAIRALETVDEPTLLVFPDAVTIGGNVAYGKIVDAALASCLKTRDRFTVADVKAAVPGGNDTNAKVTDNFRNRITTTGPDLLNYGAAYFPYVVTSLPLRFADSHVTLTSFHRVTVDGFGNTVSRVAEPGKAGKKLSDATLALSATDSVAYTAIHAFLSQARATLPPSAAVAGVYATVDRTRGVWKAPASIALAAVVAPAIAVSNELQDALNVDATSGKSVNAIRAFPGKGTLVWGARTLAGNDNEWRYVNVRRLANFLEESVSKATTSFVFEPNDASTWVRVRAMIENFLTNLWREGALLGAKPEHAFYVRVGLNQTMTAQDIVNGRMIVEIGFAPLRPAEFVIVRITQRISTP